MKHEGTYYTCDRCGVKIDYMEINAHKFFPKKRKIPISATINYQTRKGYIADEQLSIPATHALLIEYYDRSIQNIHLCGKCAEEFKKFMEEKKND